MVSDLEILVSFVFLQTLIIAHVPLVSGIAKSSHSSDVECRAVRLATKTGFHRDIDTTLTFPLPSYWPAESSCWVLMNETIPSGMFIDLYHTERQHQFGGPKVFSPVDIDLELPEYESHSHTVYVYHKLTQKIRDDGTKTGVANIVYPVHLRYHRPSEEKDYEQVVLNPAGVLLHCNMFTDQSADTKTRFVVAPCFENTSAVCDWLPLTCHGNEELVFSIPVGRLGHYTAVLIVTTVVTVVMTVVIAVAVLRTSLKDEDDRVHSSDKVK